MAYLPVSGAVTQYSESASALASGYFLKGYEAGTTTPLSMGVDSTPTSTLAKCAFNSDGNPISNPNDPTTEFIPHFNADYKLVLYANETDADNDTTANAVWVIDNISLEAQVTVNGKTNSISDYLSNKEVATYAELRALTSSQLGDNDLITVTGDGISGSFVVKTGTVTDNGGTLIVFTDDSNRYAERAFEGYYNILWFGADGSDDTVDQTTAIQNCIDAADLDGVQSNFHHKTVFLPTPLDGYLVTGLNCYQRVDLVGEAKWNCRVVVQGAGNYGVEQPRRVTNIFFDGGTIANGANRIEEASWTRASDRANTGVIMGPADQSFQGGHGIVDECRFASLGVCVERGDSIDTTVRNCYILSCWHGIFSRADGVKAFASMLYDVKNYISQNSGIGIGFYTNTNGYSQWACENNVVEVCCTDAVHDGVNGFIDSGGATFITPGCRNLYIEGDEVTYPSAIGIRSAIFNADGFVIQGTGDPFVTPGANSFWRLTNGQIFETVNTYDMVFGSGGRNLLINMSLDNGLNPAALGNTTLIDCSSSGVLPNNNSNHWIDDGQMYIGRQSDTPLLVNRRASNGSAVDIQRQGTTENSIMADTDMTYWNLPHGVRSYTVAGLPSASTYNNGSSSGIIYVSDETGGPTLAFSDGTSWRRVQDRAVVS